MRLREWVVSIPSNLGHFDDIEDSTIDYVKEEVATDYCLPALWQAWVIGDPDGSEVEVCVTRLSHGSSFPVMMSGYCEVIDDWDVNECVIEIYSPTGLEGYVGKRDLYGNVYNCWLCPDGQYRAQLCVSTGN